MPNYRVEGNMGFISTNDLSAAGSYGKAVKIDSSNAPDHIVLAGANGTGAIGVLIDTPGVGQTGTVRLRSCAGTSFIRLSGTVAVNDAITSAAGGTGITTVTAGDEIIGRALSAGVSGDIIEILPSTGKY